MKSLFLLGAAAVAQIFSGVEAKNKEKVKVTSSLVMSSEHGKENEKYILLVKDAPKPVPKGQKKVATPFELPTVTSVVNENAFNFAIKKFLKNSEGARINKKSLEAEDEVVLVYAKDGELVANKKQTMVWANWNDITKEEERVRTYSAGEKAEINAKVKTVKNENMFQTHRKVVPAEYFVEVKSDVLVSFDDLMKEEKDVKREDKVVRVINKETRKLSEMKFDELVSKSVTLKNTFTKNAVTTFTGRWVSWKDLRADGKMISYIVYSDDRTVGFASIHIAADVMTKIASYDSKFKLNLPVNENDHFGTMDVEGLVEDNEAEKEKEKEKERNNKRNKPTTGNVNIDVPVTESETEKPVAGQVDSEGINWWLVGGISGAVIVVLIAAVFFIKSRKN